MDGTYLLSVLLVVPTALAFAIVAALPLVVAVAGFLPIVLVFEQEVANHISLDARTIEIGS